MIFRRAGARAAESPSARTATSTLLRKPDCAYGMYTSVGIELGIFQIADDANHRDRFGNRADVQIESIAPNASRAMLSFSTAVPARSVSLSQRLLMSRMQPPAHSLQKRMDANHMSLVGSRIDGKGNRAAESEPNRNASRLHARRGFQALEQLAKLRLLGRQLVRLRTK